MKEKPEKSGKWKNRKIHNIPQTLGSHAALPSFVATENGRVYTSTREGAHGRSHKHSQGGVPLESGGSSQTPRPCSAAPPTLRRDWQTPPPQGTPFPPATGSPKGTRGLQFLQPSATGRRLSNPKWASYGEIRQARIHPGEAIPPGQDSSRVDGRRLSTGWKPSTF